MWTDNVSYPLRQPKGPRERIVAGVIVALLVRGVACMAAVLLTALGGLRVCNICTHAWQAGEKLK